MKSIKICAVQFKVSPNLNKNIARIEPFFKKANRNKCDIICFPEAFLTGGLPGEKYNPKVPIEAKKLFSKLSKKYQIFSLMGSITERIKNKLYNICYLFDDRGRIVGNYKKNHLTKEEKKRLKPGNEVSVLRTKIGNIGIQICRDLLYPEITRKLMLKGAEIIFCPSFWSAKSSSYDWIYSNKYFKNKAPNEVDALVSARAIESEVIFVYVNAAGNFNLGKNRNILLGRTQIAFPFYGTTAKLSHNKESHLIKEADLKIVKDAKIVYKIGKDLKSYYK